MNELMIVNSNDLPIEQRQLIDEQINQIIQQHKNNRGEINRLTFDCVTALAAGQSRGEELASQGFFSRLWGGLTGKNQQLQGEINRNYAAAQYASQVCLQKLAEQNLMTFELVAAVNNKLNSFAMNVASEFNNVNREINNVYGAMNQGFKNVGDKFESVDREIDNVYDNMNQGFKNVAEEFNNVYNILGNFFRQTQSDILQLDQRIDRLEQNVKLLNWTNSIEYQRFDGIEYEALSTVGKIICLTKDFYEITKGKWSLSDLLLLKRALSDVGLPSKQKITYLDFLQGLIEEPKFLQILLNEVNLDDVDAVYTTLLETVKKYKLLTTSEKYQVDSISEMMSSHGVELPQREITTNMVTKYIGNVAGVSLNAEVSIFEFCLELIYNIEQIKYNQDQKLLTEQTEKENFDKLEAELKSKIQEIDSLKEELNSKSREFSNVKSQLESKSVEFNNIKSQLDSKSVEFNKLKLQLNAKNQEINKLKTQSQSYPSSDDEYNKAYEYEHGYNRYRDLSIAKYWYAKSAENGNLAAKKALIRLQNV